MSDKVYTVITDQILSLLEKGTIPWKKSWTGSAGLGGHKNLISQSNYRGINAFMTAATAMDKGYKSPYWLTYAQAAELGGHVKKGESSIPIVFYSVGTKQNDQGEEKSFGFARYSRVFNSEQIECPGLEKILAKRMPQEKVDFNPIAACEDIVFNYCPKPAIRHDFPSAYYMPRADVINMPKPETFTSAENYYSVLFHELSHSTGHGTRLARTGITDAAKFGDHSYSKEELIAEMGAAFLCAHAGIETQTIENSAAYIQSWLKVLKGEPRLVLQAASAAQKAAEHMLGITKKEEQKEEQPETVGTEL